MIELSPLMVSEPDQAEALQTRDPVWPTNGRRGLIQPLTTNRGRQSLSGIARPAP
jgi:hypothetical protein